MGAGRPVSIKIINGQFYDQTDQYYESLQTIS